MLISGSAENRAEHPVWFGCAGTVGGGHPGRWFHCELWVVDSQRTNRRRGNGTWNTEDRINSKQLGVTRRPGSRTG